MIPKGLHHCCKKDTIRRSPDVAYIPDAQKPSSKQQPEGSGELGFRVEGRAPEDDTAILICQFLDEQNSALTNTSSPTLSPRAPKATSQSLNPDL